MSRPLIMDRTFDDGTTLDVVPCEVCGKEWKPEGRVSKHAKAWCQEHLPKEYAMFRTMAVEYIDGGQEPKP